MYFGHFRVEQIDLSNNQIVSRGMLGNHLRTLIIVERRRSQVLLNMVQNYIFPVDNDQLNNIIIFAYSTNKLYKINNFLLII